MTRRIQSDALKLLAWLGCTLLLGAVLAPALFNLGKAMVGFRMFDGYLAKVLSESDFGRYFNRAMLLAALICLVPLLLSLRVRKADIGLEKNRSWWAHSLGGFVLAGGILLAMGFVYLQMGLFRPEAKNPFELEMAGKFLLSAVCVGLLEEFIFRGALFGAVSRATRPLAALLFVTFFFALVHFLKPPEGLVVDDADVGIGTGFWMVGQIFARFGNPMLIAAEFATLFAVGLVLGWARIRTRSLWLAIGLHAGWVFCLKMYDYHTFIPKRYRPDLALPYVGADLKTGLIPLTAVCLTGVLAALCLRLGLRRRLGRDHPHDHAAAPA